MKYINSILIIAFLFLFPQIKAQIYLTEGFESVARPTGWTEQIVSGSKSWRFQNGGYGTIPGIRFPQTAHTGSYNALFQIEMIGPKTKLITKPIDLSTAKKPELRFWHAQEEWGTDQFDKLRIYYKNSLANPWILLHEYLDRIPNWVGDTIPLPENALTSTCYIAFEAESNWGFGVVIDDVELIETGIIPMQLTNFNISQASTSFIPTQAKNNPILKIDVDIYGNSGTMIFDSISINAINQDNNDISNSGVKLYHTVSQFFSPTNQIGTSQNIGSGTINFSNLNLELPYGKSYIWVTLDVDSLATHGNYVDASILTNSIKLYLDTSEIAFDEDIYPEADSIVFIIDEETIKAPINYILPQSTISPAGSRNIEESIFYDNFESSGNWTLTGDFQINTPLGLGGTEGGTPDPVNAYSESKVLGNDLTGLGSKAGDYENSVSDVYYAETPVINAYYFKNIKLTFFQWLNLESFDDANIMLSIDSGYSWTPIYTSVGNIADYYWNRKEFNLTSYDANRNPGIKLKITLGTTDGSNCRSGWNVDNFAITGDYIAYDANLSRILSPLSGCGHTSADSVTIIVKNLGGFELTSVPMKYTFNGGGSYIYDTIYQTIAPGDSVQFTFSERINLSNPEIYNVIISTDLQNDEYGGNNQISTALYAQPTLAPPYLENFETAQGLWMVNGLSNSSWEWGTPSHGIIPTSGTNAWMTTLFGYYYNNDSSFIESPCYDFSDGRRFFVGLNYRIRTQSDIDGVALEYSIDNGETWGLLDTNEYNWNWEWYNSSMVQELGTKGWSGIDEEWSTIFQLTPSSTINQPKVKFRYVFESDTNGVDLGFTMDDFAVYPVAPDIGVVEIDSPIDDCQFSNSEYPTVSIKNYGLNALEVNDTIIIGIDITGNPTIIDTFQLVLDILPNDTFQYTFTTPVNINSTGFYNITAYTLIEDDPWLYFGNNDTLTKNVEIFAVPFTSLLDTIQSREPDTVILRTYYNVNYTYEWTDNLSDADTLKVPGNGVFYVTVTDLGSLYNCQSVDSTYVELLYNDVGIDSIVSPISSCELGSAEYIEVLLKNFGTDSLIAGDRIRLVLEFDYGPSIEDTIELSNSFYSKSTMLHTFYDVAYNMTGVDVYNIKSYAEFGGDTVYVNDTAIKNIEVFGYPTVDVGPDVSIAALSYLLDAGPGYDSYLWNTGDITQTTLVTEAGWYGVLVYDEHNCPAEDSAYVYLKIRDVLISDVNSPSSGCDKPAGDQVELVVYNNGTDTIKTSDVTYVKYKLDSDPYEQESVNLLTDLLPNQSVIHEFSKVENLSAYRDYNFEFIAYTAGDMRTWNDTIDTIITNKPNPVIDFGLESPYIVRALQYTLDAGAGANYSYLWQDNSTNRIFTAFQDGNYSVVVIDTITGCTGSDAVLLLFIISDIEPLSVNISNNICSDIYDNINVVIRNSGNTSIGAGGTNFRLGYKLNNEAPVSQVVNVTQQWNQGSVLSFALPSLEITQEGSNNINIFAKLDGDLRIENDTLYDDFNVLPSPVVDFGGESISVILPYTLDAGSGYESYLWQDNSTDHQLTVGSPGTYTVTVTSSNSCETIKSVIVESSSAINDYTREMLDLYIYPVPSTQFITLDINLKTRQDIILDIVDNNSRTLYRENIDDVLKLTKELQVGTFPSGIYFIRIYNKDLMYISKIIIE